jgi:hypothetical protein
VGTEPTEFCELHGGRMLTQTPPPSWLSRIFGGKTKSDDAPPPGADGGTSSGPAINGLPTARPAPPGTGPVPAAASPDDDEKKAGLLHKILVSLVAEARSGHSKEQTRIHNADNPHSGQWSYERLILPAIIFLASLFSGAPPGKITRLFEYSGYPTRQGWTPFRQPKQYPEAVRCTPGFRYSIEGCRIQLPGDRTASGRQTGRRPQILRASHQINKRFAAPTTISAPPITRKNNMKALSQYQRALSLQPNVASVYTNVSCVLRWKRLPKAMEAFHKALTIDPHVFERRASADRF